MIWEFYEGIQKKYGINQKTGFLCNIGHGKRTLGSVGCRVELTNQNQEEEDIMCGSCSGYCVLWRFKGRGSFPHATKGDDEFSGRDQNKKGAITRDGDPTGAIKSKDSRKVAHDAIFGQNGLKG